MSKSCWDIKVSHGQQLPQSLIAVTEHTHETIFKYQVALGTTLAQAQEKLQPVNAVFSCDLK